jgi:ketosteroid isomerase-like protein
MYKESISLGIMALVAFGSADPREARAASTGEAANTIRRLDASLLQAVESRDLEKIVGFYSSDASLLPDRVPIATGTDAIRGTWQHVLALRGFKMSFAPTRIDVAKARDMASDIGIFSLTCENASGSVSTTVGKYVVVWKKQHNGLWRITADIFNADPEPQS